MQTYCQFVTKITFHVNNNSNKNVIRVATYCSMCIDNITYELHTVSCFHSTSWGWSFIFLPNQPNPQLI